MPRRIYQELIRVNILRHTDAGQDHMDELLNFCCVIASFKCAQVLNKSFIRSNFEAFKVLLFEKLESHKILSTQVFLRYQLFIKLIY